MKNTSGIGVLINRVERLRQDWAEQAAERLRVLLESDDEPDAAEPISMQSLESMVTFLEALPLTGRPSMFTWNGLFRVQWRDDVRHVAVEFLAHPEKARLVLFLPDSTRPGGSSHIAVDVSPHEILSTLKARSALDWILV
jgi:hypothetical protein